MEAAQERVKLSSYFDAMTGFIRDSEESAERFNMMSIVVKVSSTDTLKYQFTYERVDGLLSNVVVEYLKPAPGDDAFEIAGRIEQTRGLSPGIAREFERYAKSSGALSPEQRASLLDLIARALND